ncbi:hypothetical protein [Lactobacillus acetotolerans]|uniref:hypothetical protein n=1 Tax=Lactobacillus acetotolerans TaxID=1600 RepID=UPI002FDA1E82
MQNNLYHDIFKIINDHEDSWDAAVVDYENLAKDIVKYIKKRDKEVNKHDD